MKINYFFPYLLILLFSCEELKTKIENLNSYNNVSIFKNSVHSVVNISSTRTIVGQSFLQGKRQFSSVGSGIVWDKKGHIVTNAHVINNASQVFVSFYQNKKLYRAKVVGMEPEQDLAVLKIADTSDLDFKPIKKGYSNNLNPGEKVLAIGSPFNLDYTITSGIISALSRVITTDNGVEIKGIIQTDAPINPGNSGGPLLDAEGKLIGINTGIYSTSGGSNGISFAIPINTASKVVGDIIKYGKVIRPIIGVNIQDYKGKGGGVHIIKVLPNSPAAKAGLKGARKKEVGLFQNVYIYLGDIITAINNERVKNYSDLYHLLGKYKPGNTVSIEILRNERKLSFDLVLASNE